MLYIFSGIILIIFAVFGVVSFIGEIILAFTRTSSQDIITLVKISEKNESDAEYILRSTAARVKWLGKNFSSSVICVDFGMSPETRELCAAICDEYSFMELKTAQEICSGFKI